jgi:hypothetical protein
MTFESRSSCRSNSSVTLPLLKLSHLELFSSNGLLSLQGFVDFLLLLSLLPSLLQIEELPHLTRAEYNSITVFRGSELLHELLTTILLLLHGPESIKSLLLVKLGECQLCFGAKQLIGKL